MLEHAPNGAQDGTAEDASQVRRSPETVLLCRVQDVIAKPAVVRIAQGMSVFGEHSGGWLALGALGALVDRKRRKDWIIAAGGVFAAHAASVVVKRVVKRKRPNDPEVRVLVGTPSKLSFPSAHATSTTAAAVLYSGLTGRNLTPLLVPPMLLSRMVLGVHYPSDVLVGSALGATIGGVVRGRLSRRKGKASD
ncbi:phosphatase PAP2 family protein [Tamaricihabitans halophyticus]|nr:phosphatase PAP2 family protein [Tamaricihabitans halophyticus]